ncbi:hypothetical protein [Pseudoxanthomonas sp. PXM04]|uniref:hypothetical protein n=1 Tax=Pseudoxanthomonas sp. PXM04 TaxID=2769297 RepID=UPI00178102D5|nr:hypothetical protein [Pseudoxanthomonas sp. PXM04]MBD9376186.1 hypothetical protein [Pseudoxanthomonas sp. PXM04]
MADSETLERLTKAIEQQAATAQRLVLAIAEQTQVTAGLVAAVAELLGEELGTPVANEAHVAQDVETDWDGNAV